MARKSHRDKADVEEWVQRQGYALEREVAAALKPWGFRSTLGRHYLDASTGKVREIDLVADAQLASHIAMFAVVECKHSSPIAGAWIARESDLRRPHRSWAPILSQTLERRVGALLGTILGVFPLGRDRFDEDRVAFSIVEATDESNDVAYDAIRQAVDGALGWAHEHDGLALCVPVVVMDVPLFALYHADGGDEALVEVPWRRMLWWTARGPTIVDVVTRGHLADYAKGLRWSFDQIAALGLAIDDEGSAAGRAGPGRPS